MVNLSDTITGLPELGTDIGGFLTNLTPGLVGFIAAMTVIGAVLAILIAISVIVKRKIGGK